MMLCLKIDTKSMHFPTLHFSAPFPVKSVTEEVQSKWRDSQLQKLVGKWGGGKGRRERTQPRNNLTSTQLLDLYKLKILGMKIRR